MRIIIDGRFLPLYSIDDMDDVNVIDKNIEVRAIDVNCLGFVNLTILAIPKMIKN